MVKLLRVVSRIDNSAGPLSQLPSDFARRKPRGKYIENGISLWRADLMNAKTAIDKVKAGKNTAQTYGALAIDSSDLEALGLTVTLGPQHVNVRCQGCNLVQNLKPPPICKSSNGPCGLDERESSEVLAKIVGFAEVTCQ